MHHSVNEQLPLVGQSERLLSGRFGVIVSNYDTRALLSAGKEEAANECEKKKGEGRERS